MKNIGNRLREGEKMVLWIGDILGKLMGYPSKRDLAKFIYNDLDKHIKAEIKDKNSLSEVSQVYLDSVTGSKLKLLNKLKNSHTNSQEVSNLFCLFPKAPFIDSIVTTNFDNLIENAYGDSIYKFKNLDDFGKNNDLPSLYKINGEFEHLDKMLVTSQDFRKLKTLSIYNPMFESLKKELKGKLVLFIGYDLEDSNTKELLSLIYTKFGDFKPNAYFVTSSSIINTETINWLNLNEIKLLKQNEIEFLDELKKYLIEEGHILDTSSIVEEELSEKKKYK
jgi:hypothetical protein